ncbi:cytochrome c oxidase assembly protein [Crenothrix polyspora]|uniref:Cytochrome c oxidase assembly protein CtaG n=1 Tax=Crenothrix polyspora TaxID=360316 RepID=A0A1R4HCZ2_9GAMM|nr:cytochrome c oxidase assembly protein [Crenothrix polyspora]SJM93740.1 Cytochrome oxidase assembly factor [Crenothrix polyspora]
MAENLSSKNTKLARMLVLVAVAMFGFGYALVPLYNWVCVDLLGLKNSTDINTTLANKAALAKETVYTVDKDRQVLVEFITVLNDNIPMTFRAQTPQMKVHPGEYYTVNFIAQNTSNKTILAQAKPSLSPAPVTPFFEKTQCFCFIEQTFKPKETKVMPIRFVVKPDLSTDYKTITLLYTFFDITDKK